MGFIAALLFVMLCVNAIVRQQWTRNERLTYPIVQLPVAMADPQAQALPPRAALGGDGRGGRH